MTNTVVNQVFFSGSLQDLVDMCKTIVIGAGCFNHTSTDIIYVQFLGEIDHYLYKGPKVNPGFINMPFSYINPLIAPALQYAYNQNPFEYAVIEREEVKNKDGSLRGYNLISARSEEFLVGVSRATPLETLGRVVGWKALLDVTAQFTK